MLPSKLLEQVSELTDDQLYEMLDFVRVTEPNRRRQEVEMARTVRELQDAGELPKPETTDVTKDEPKKVSDVAAWVDPGTIHSRMYHYGAVVAHKNHIWQSEHRGLNHWEPGAKDIDERIWRDITDEVTKPAGDDPKPGAGDDGGVKPFKAGINVKPGDVLEYQGARYEVVQAHTTADHWPPPSVPALFKKL